MEKIIECIPNFSEGKRQDVIEAIADEVRAVKDVTLWFYSSDVDYNRMCIGFIGSPEGVKTAAINASLKAAELIDMRTHKGAHPRDPVCPASERHDRRVRSRCTRGRRDAGKKAGHPLLSLWPGRTGAHPSHAGADPVHAV